MAMTDSLVQKSSSSGPNGSAGQSTTVAQVKTNNIGKTSLKMPNGSSSSVPASTTPNGASSSSASSSSCPSPTNNGGVPSVSNSRGGGSRDCNDSVSEMYAAIEELRRENERLLAELANTQEVLDLFENYRDLSREHMSMCICSGKDYHLGKWKQYEADYRKLMPIKRIIEPSLLLKNAAPQYSDGVVSIVDGSSLNYQVGSTKNSTFGTSKSKGGANRFDTLPGGTPLIKACVSTSDVTCSLISPNSGKSKIRSFLDSIAPIDGVNLTQQQPDQFSQVQSILTAVPFSQSNSQPMHSTPQQQSNQINLMHKGNQIIIRKRIAPPELMAASNEDEESSSSGPVINQNANNMQGFVVKKARLSSNALGGSFAPGQKYTILTTNNKFTIPSGNSNKVILSQSNSNKLFQQQQQQQQDPDQEEERLDQLNNALDQILMGRYDALNQLQPRPAGMSSRTLLAQAAQGQTHMMMQEEVVDEEAEYDENQGDEEQQFVDEDDEDIIFLDEVKNQSSINANINSNINNRSTSTATAIAVPLKPKIVIAENTSAGPTASILGAALESGFKPYPTYHQISTNNSSKGAASNAVSSGTLLAVSNSQPIMNHATIKIFQPSTSHTTASGTTTATPIAVALQPNIATTNNNVTVINNKALFQKRPHLTNEERMDIINRLKKNESGARIARDYGITKQAVSAIKRRAQLMGDNFSNVNTYIQAFGASNSAGNSSTNSGSNSTSVKASPVTINLSPNISGSSSPVDNSLVSRQMKQQAKVNATVLRQSNLLASMPRATSNLCLPVNPVAIIKSQMAKQSSSNTNSGASTPTGAGSSSNNNTSSKSKLDSKRLLLPRLLQGTETYQSYATSAKNFDDSKLAIKEESDQEVPKSSLKVKRSSGKPASFAMQNIKQESLDEDYEEPGQLVGSSEEDQDFDSNGQMMMMEDEINGDNGNIGLMMEDEEVDAEEDEFQHANNFDPNDYIEMGAYSTGQLEDEEEPEDDINNNPDISMSMFPTLEEQMDEAMGGHMGTEDDEDNHGDSIKHEDDLNGPFDDSMLMSD